MPGIMEIPEKVEKLREDLKRLRVESDVPKEILEEKLAALWGLKGVGSARSYLNRLLNQDLLLCLVRDRSDYWITTKRLAEIRIPIYLSCLGVPPQEQVGYLRRIKRLLPEFEIKPYS